LFEIGNQVNRGDYRLAQNALSRARVIIDSNSCCGLDQTQIIAYNEFVPAASKYQQLGLEAQEALENNENSKLLELFQEMEILSARHEYIRTAIEARPLYYLFAVKSNLVFLETSINSYNSENEFLIAFRIMNVLESGAATGRETRLIQEQLGEKLALADRNRLPAADPLQNVEKYTKGKTYYKYFRKAYLDSWNNR
jgi:hypothetical protein